MPAIVGPGETLASTGREIFAGGKGLNQSIAAARAGARVRHYGAVGEDGEFLSALLHAEGIDASGVAVQSGPSGHAIIQVDSQGRNAIVISGGSNRALPASLLQRALNAVADDNWLLLQNETNFISEALLQAPDAGRIALNLAPPDQRINSYSFDRVDLLIVNEAEAIALAAAFSVAAEVELTAATALAEIKHRWPRTNVVLTLGKQGLICVDRDAGRQFSLSSFAVDAVDETAAGDAFVGYLMAGLCEGAPLLEALTTASAAGALAVTAPGAAASIPTVAQVQRLLASQQLTMNG